jgi:hypothetical protein
MECVDCGSAAVSERRDSTAQGYRGFRCHCSLRSENRLNRPATSPPDTACFDIFSPAPGNNDAIIQVERLSSNDTKIALRSVRMAARLSGREMNLYMIVSEVSVDRAHRGTAHAFPAYQPIGLLRVDVPAGEPGGTGGSAG